MTSMTRLLGSAGCKAMLIERLIARLSPVENRSGQRASDLQVSSFSIRVAFSRPPASASLVAFPRWSWTVPRTLAYDYLLLIGEKPERFRDLYPSDGAANVYYLVPGSASERLFDRFQPDQICLFVHPEAEETKAHDLVKKWSVSQHEIEEAFVDADF